MGYDIKHYDIWFTHCIVSILNSSLREDWEISEEESRHDNDGHFLPSSFDSLVKFFEKRIQSFEQAQAASIWGDSQIKKQVKHSSKGFSQSCNANSASSVEKRALQFSSFKFKCPKCQGAHYLRQKFLDMTVRQRISVAKTLKACLNYLGINHFVFKCRSTKSCSVRGQKHHTRLHLNDQSSNLNSESSSNHFDCTANHSDCCLNQNETSISHCESVKNHSDILNPSTTSCCTSVGLSRLLATAQIILVLTSQKSIKVRALIDPGSQFSFITERVARILGVERHFVSVDIFGVGSSSSHTSKAEASLTLKSPHASSFNLSFSALILNQLTKILPQREIRYLGNPGLILKV